MSRIHLYVHGRGRGHASRAAELVPALRSRGHQVRVFAGGDAVDRLGELGELAPIEPLPPRLDARTMWLFARRVRAAVRALVDDAAELVISDGDVPAIWAAALGGRPRIAIGHGLVFDRCRRPAGIDARAWRRERAKAWPSAALASRCVAVSFCPLTRREPRMLRAPQTVLARSYRSTAPAGRADGPVVCYFRDGAEPAVLAAIAARAKVVLFAPRDPCVDGVAWQPIARAEFVRALASARCVVGSAGSQLIGECLALALPLWAIHRDDDDEQRINVELLRGVGGRGGPRSTLDVRALQRFVAAPTPLAPQPWSAPDVVHATLSACDELLGARPCAS